MCYEEFPKAIMSLTYDAQINAYKNAISIVNELSEEYNGGWIACSDRLPEVGIEVLCFTTNDTIIIAEWGGEESSYLDRKAVWFPHRGWCQKDYIVAWQPLPVPYTEGE